MLLKKIISDLKSEKNLHILVFLHSEVSLEIIANFKGMLL